MDYWLLIASSHGGGHGPQMHGPVFLVLMAVALVVGLVLLIRKLRAPKDSDLDRGSRPEHDDVSGPGAESGVPPGERSA